MLLPDDAQRIRVRTSRASLAVEASAGTGKTYLLVVRALWLLLVKRIPAEALVAVAFGEQAATELRERLRAKLVEIVRAPGRDELDPEVQAMAPTEPLATLQRLAAEALDGLERAHISTIHAFASTLLRLYPVESGVDPAFEVIEEAGYAELLRDEWSRFVAEELGAEAPRRAEWLALLAGVRLTDLAELGAALAEYDTDLALLPERPVLSEAAKRWLLDVATDAELLVGEIPDGRKKAVGALAGFAAAARAAADRGQQALRERAEPLEQAAELTRSDVPKDLETRSLRLFLEVTGAAKALRAVPGEATIFAAVRLLRPFAGRVRDRLRREGRLTYAGLLALARDLVRNHAGVRAQLNRRFRAILLDEAQDVDPMQLELLLFLAEAPGGGAASWREVTLEPGKLFVVGDPKQSIYLFRGADARAFRSALDLMVAQGAETLAPTTSMRSNQSVLDAVNAVGVQYFTGYPALAARPDRPAAPAGAGAEVLVVEPADGEEAEAVEAAAVAARIRALLGEGIKPFEIAVLFRKRGPMPAFAAALRAAGVEVAIEQERRFYLRQDVMDLINVVRYAADAADEVALAGVLRGPYGGLTDAQLEAFFLAGRRWTGEAPGPAGRLLGEVFPRLAAEARSLPPREWLESVYQSLGVEAVADASADPGAREAVRGFRRMLGPALETFGLPRALELIEESLRAEGDPGANRQPPLLPPRPAAGEAEQAVRFLTVHNAKGLEFPVVILAAIDATPQQQRSTDTEVLHDFAGGASGVTLRAIGAKEAAATLDGCRLKALRDETEREETARLVYVALTRARDRLIVVDRRPGSGRKPGRTADTFRPHLAALIEYPNSPVSRERSAVTRAAGPAREAASGRPGASTVPALRPQLEAEAEVVTPTEIDERLRREESSGELLPAGTRTAKAWLGELCHEVLRAWDYGAGDPAGRLPAAIEAAQARIGGARELPDDLRRRIREVLTGFLASEDGRMLREARILGREVPLLARVDGRTISARADVVYETAEGVMIGDFKLTPKSEPSGAEERSYAAAGETCLGRACGFRVLPLTGGEPAR